MTPAARTLAFIRTLSAIAYFLVAMVLFVFAAWLVGPVAEFWWPAVISGALIAWMGVGCVRRGCEELVLNETHRSPSRGSANDRR
jgi:hypothetical protein